MNSRLDCTRRDFVDKICVFFFFFWRMYVLALKDDPVKLLFGLPYSYLKLFKRPT